MSAPLPETPAPLDSQLPGSRPLGFALCHGWGLDARSMAPLAEALLQVFPTGTIVCELMDLGFGGAPQHPVLETSRDWIAVGHSYGFAWLLQQPSPAPTPAFPWRAAVAINGFTRFCRRPGQPEGTPPRLLDAMLSRLASDPEATVHNFRQRCGVATDDPAFSLAALEAEQAGQERDSRLQALHQHLQALRLLELALPACPVLALATEGDVIVPPALARACFSAPVEGRQAPLALRFLPGDHVSLLRQAALLAGLIHQWLDKNDD